MSDVSINYSEGVATEVGIGSAVPLAPPVHEPEPEPAPEPEPEPEEERYQYQQPEQEYS